MSLRRKDFSFFTMESESQIVPIPEASTSQQVNSKEKLEKVIRESIESNSEIPKELEKHIEREYTPEFLEVLRHKSNFTDESIDVSSLEPNQDPTSDGFWESSNVVKMGKLKLRWSFSPEIGFYIHIYRDNNKRFPPSKLSFPLTDVVGLLRYLRKIKNEILHTPRGKLIPSLKNHAPLAHLSRKHKQFWSPDVVFETESKRLKVRPEISGDFKYFITFLRERKSQQEYSNGLSLWKGPTFSISIGVLKMFISALETFYIDCMLLSNSKV